MRLAGLWPTQNLNGGTFSLLYRYAQDNFSYFL